MIRLAAVPTFATRWLIPRLPDLALAQPDLVVHIETRTRPFMFTDTDFDAALYSGTPAQVASWAGTRAVELISEDVVPVCAPQLLGGRKQLKPKALTTMPLLQQSTRPEGWGQWFDAQGLAAPLALAGPRYELFSMTAAAAAQGMGVALVPRLLIEAEPAGRTGGGVRQTPARRTQLLPRHPGPRGRQAALQAFAGWLEATARRNLLADDHRVNIENVVFAGSTVTRTQWMDGLPKV